MNPTLDETINFKDIPILWRVVLVYGVISMIWTTLIFIIAFVVGFLGVF